MKKFSVVLLVAVLAVSSVFAGITGYVTAKYTIDFDEGTFNYTDPDTLGDLEAAITFDSLDVAKKGEGKAFVDAVGSFSWTAKSTKKDKRFGVDTLGYFQLSLDKLNIVGEDWVWNLTEAKHVGNYADSTLDSHTWYRNDKLKDGMKDMITKLIDADTSRTDYLKDADVKTTLADTLVDDDHFADKAKTVAYGAGFDFFGDSDVYGTTFTKCGYSVALAANGHVGDYTTKTNQIFYFGIETKEFELGDAKVQAAIGTSYRQDNANGDDDLWTIGASFKAEYASDAFSLKIATDQGIKTLGKETREKNDSMPFYNGDVLVQAEVGPVSADVFFGKAAESKKGDDKDYVWAFGDSVYAKNKHAYHYYSEQGLYKKNVVKNLFSFQVKADLNEFDVPATVTFQALNMVNDAKIFNVFADAKLGDLSLSVYAKDLLASYDKIYGAKAKAYYGSKATDQGSLCYWDENGAKQKLGIDASYVVDEALTVKAGFFAQLGARKIGANVGATYVADLFTADASLAAEFLCASKSEMSEMNMDSVDAEDYNKMQLIVGVKSDKIVDGALLSIEYKSGNLLDNDLASYDFQAGQKAGKLTTKCKVTF